MVLLWGMWSAWAGVGETLTLEPYVETLPNGLTVVLSEDHRTDTVALHLVYGVGARDERAPAEGQPGEFGCAHLFEHLMFEGSANVPTNKFDAWLTSGGGSNNAYTSRDVTAYYMGFPSGALELALFLESDRMAFLEPGLIKANLENQQGVVLQERAQSYAEPHGRDWTAINQLRWGADHPYHHPVIGTEADIRGFDLGAVRGFWRRYYRPSNAILVLAGNLETKEAIKQVRRWFSDVPYRGDAPSRAAEQVESGIRGPVRGLLTDRVEERTVYFTWETVPYVHKDRPALELTQRILSGGRGTRLDDRMYHRKSLASGVGASLYATDVAGQMMIYATSVRTPLRKLERVIQGEVKRLAKRAPEEEELVRAKRRWLAGVLDDLESPWSRAERLAECMRIHGNADCLASEWAAIEAVTPGDIRQVTATYLEVAPIALSVVPEGDDGALADSSRVEIP